MKPLFGVERSGAIGSREKDMVWPQHATEAGAFEEWRRLRARDGDRPCWLLLRFDWDDVGWQICPWPSTDGECPT